MIATDLVRAALHGTLAVLIFAGGASVAEMIVIEAPTSPFWSARRSERPWCSVSAPGRRLSSTRPPL